MNTINLTKLSLVGMQLPENIRRISTFRLSSEGVTELVIAIESILQNKVSVFIT
jgi:hypothetical protein